MVRFQHTSTLSCQFKNISLPFLHPHMTIIHAYIMHSGTICAVVQIQPQIKSVHFHFKTQNYNTYHTNSDYNQHSVAFYRRNTKLLFPKYDKIMKVYNSWCHIMITDSTVLILQHRGCRNSCVVCTWIYVLSLRSLNV